MPLVPLPYRILVEKDEGGQHWLVVLWSVQVRHDPGLTEESSATKTRRVDFHKRLRAHDGNIFIQGKGSAEDGRSWFRLGCSSVAPVPVTVKDDHDV